MTFQVSSVDKIPFVVADGGTGRASLSANVVLLGGSTSTVGLAGPGVTGSIFIGNGSASAPSFSTSASVNMNSVTFNGTNQNAFSSYSEVTTWSPTISGSTTAGTGTYSTFNGYYHTIGNIILLQGLVTVTAHTGTGNLLLTNFPKTVRNLTNYTSMLNISINFINFPSGADRFIIALCQPNTTQATVSMVSDNVANTAVALPTSARINFSGWYLT